MLNDTPGNEATKPWRRFLRAEVGAEAGALGARAAPGWVGWACQLSISAEGGGAEVLACCGVHAFNL